MKRYLHTAVAVAIVGLFTTSSNAQNAPLSKGYLGFEFGAVKFKDQQSIASGLVGAVGGTASSVQDTGTTIGRFFGGLSVNENFGAELGYIMSGTANASFSGVSSGSVAYSGTASQKTTGFDYSALIRPGISTGYNGLFLRVGGHSLSTKVDVNIVTGSSSGVSSSTTSGTGSLIGIGYDGKINDKLDFRLAYTAYNSVGGVSGNDTSLVSFGLIAKF
jgi:hypothetical protein